ncbi:hypothetical protein DFH09DRAFT_1107927 [Mycena vulgaris]|nr:hypothetical protein DFH09DRAFT_1107927 [Mycena vulgaris]
MQAPEQYTWLSPEAIVPCAALSIQNTCPPDQTESQFVKPVRHRGGSAYLSSWSMEKLPRWLKNGVLWVTELTSAASPRELDERSGYNPSPVVYYPQSATEGASLRSMPLSADAPEQMNRQPSPSAQWNLRRLCGRKFRIIWSGAHWERNEKKIDFSHGTHEVAIQTEIYEWSEQIWGFFSQDSGRSIIPELRTPFLSIQMKIREVVASERWLKNIAGQGKIRTTTAEMKQDGSKMGVEKKGLQYAEISHQTVIRTFNLRCPRVCSFWLGHPTVTLPSETDLVHEFIIFSADMSMEDPTDELRGLIMLTPDLLLIFTRAWPFVLVIKKRTDRGPRLRTVSTLIMTYGGDPASFEDILEGAGSSIDDLASLISPGTLPALFPTLASHGLGTVLTITVRALNRTRERDHMATLDFCVMFLGDFSSAGSDIARFLMPSSMGRREHEYPIRLHQRFQNLLAEVFILATVYYYVIPVSDALKELDGFASTTAF